MKQKYKFYATLAAGFLILFLLLVIGGLPVRVGALFLTPPPPAETEDPKTSATTIPTAETINTKTPQPYPEPATPQPYPGPVNWYPSPAWIRPLIYLIERIWK